MNDENDDYSIGENIEYDFQYTTDSGKIGREAEIFIMDVLGENGRNVIDLNGNIDSEMDVLSSLGLKKEDIYSKNHRSKFDILDFTDKNHLIRIEAKGSSSKNYSISFNDKEFDILILISAYGENLSYYMAKYRDVNDTISFSDTKKFSEEQFMADYFTMIR